MTAFFDKPDLSEERTVCWNANDMNWSYCMLSILAAIPATKSGKIDLHFVCGATTNRPGRTAGRRGPCCIYRLQFSLCFTPETFYMVYARGSQTF